MNVFLKKVAAPFDKKVPACRKKTIDNPKEESITKEPFEEPITEDSKRTLSLKTFKRTVSRRYLKKTKSMRNLKRILSLRTVRSFRTLSDFSAANFFFGFLVIVYQRLGDGEKLS